MNFDDFDIDLYEEVNDLSGNGNFEMFSGIVGNNSSTSIVCATLTISTEDCNYCSGKTNGTGITYPN